MEKRIEEIFRDVMEWEDDVEVTDEMSPENVEDWDSLVSMSMVLNLEKEYGIKFAYDEILAMETIGDIKEVLKEKLA